MKCVLQIWLACFALCCLPSATVGQPVEHPIREFPNEVGLHLGFKKITQDKNDFIWLMYNEAIQRFDGQTITTYLSGERVYSLVCDDRGAIWASNKEGVFLFDAQQDRFVRVTSEDTPDVPKVLLISQDGTPVYISPNGMFGYDTEKKSFTFKKRLFQNTKAVPRITFEHLSVYGEAVFYTVADTVWKYHLTHKYKADGFFPQMRNIRVVTDNQIVVSTWETQSWLYDFATREKKRLVLPDGDAQFFVMDIAPAQSDHHYLATTKGLFLMDNTTGLLEPVRLSLQGEPFPQQHFYTLYKGTDQRLWAATDNGLLCFNDAGNAIHFLKSGIGASAYPFTSDVRNFLEDENGNLWLATVNGVTYWDLGSNTFTTIHAQEGADNQLNHPSIRGLARDGENLIIGQTNKGIWIYNPKTKTFRRPVFENSEAGEKLRQKSERDFINQITTLKNGNHIATARDGAYLIHGGSYKVEELDFPGAGFNVKFSYEDTRGHIFIGTLKGLFCLDASLRFQYKIDEELDSTWVLTIFEDEGGYYLGTEKGVYRFTAENNRPVVSKIIPELSGRWVSTFFKDDDGHLWIVSGTQLHRWLPEKKTLSTYGYAENVRGGIFYPNSYVHTRSGKVFVGGKQGINYFYPEKINLRDTELKPVIQSVNIPELDSTLTSFTRPIKLKNRYRNLEIGFTTPYYGAAKDVQYRYRMAQNGAWYNLGNQSKLTLWQLPPGSYEFELEAAITGGKWYASKEKVVFTIAPPFWKTKGFVMAATLLLCFALYKIITSFLRKLKNERLVNAFATSLYGQNSVDGILWDIAKNCIQLLNFEDCVVYLIDKERHVLVQKAAFGPKNPYGKEITNVIEIPIGNGIVGTVAQTGKAELVKNTGKDKRYILDLEQGQSEITVPVWVDGEVFAVIDSEHPRRNFYKPNHLVLLEKIAAICGERLTKYLSEENLRAKIARDLHDEMGSTLTSIHITSSLAEQDLPEGEPVKNQLAKIQRHTTGMMEKMSDMVWVVNPANDTLEKVIYRVKEYAVEVLEPAGIRFVFQDFDNTEHIKLNPEQRKNLYLIAKEALHNAVKYSKATQVKLRFAQAGGRLEMHISDNGKGFEAEKETNGNGIKNMYARAAEIKGTLQLKSEPGKGTTIGFWL